MNRALASALAAVIATLVLAVFVCVLAYSDVSDQLSSMFSEELQLASRAAAGELSDRYVQAELALDQLAPSLTRDNGLGDVRRLDALAEQLGGAQRAAFFRLDAAGRLQTAQPGVTADHVDGLVTAHQSQPIFGRRDGRERPAMAVMRHLPGGGAVGVMLSLAATLDPPTLHYLPARALAVVERPSLRVLTSSDPALTRSFDQEFQTDTGTLVRRIKAGQSGAEREATRLHPGSGGANDYLAGVTAAEVGTSKLAVVALAPRASAVGGYLRKAMRWLLMVATVLLLSIASFGAALGQAWFATKVERRRSEERQSLYQISSTLLSASELQDVLGRITERARELFHAEGATIALLDDHSGDLVFRAVSSAKPEVQQQLQGLHVPRNGVIGWVMDHAEAALVNDATKDPRFTGDVDSQTGATTMALLCAPLVDQNGTCFGAIELVNHLDDPFPPDDLVLLQSLAATSASAVERAMLLVKEKEQERMTRELDIAATVQKSLLPTVPLVVPGYDLAGLSDPAREVGGDFFDYIRLDGDRIGLVVADVADKGLGAAMFMVMCRSLLHGSASSGSATAAGRGPVETLHDLNSRLIELSTSDLFVTVLYGVLTPETGRFAFACAGHMPPLLHRAGANTLELVAGKGIALGVLEPIALKEFEVVLQPGDRLLLYTDGVTDAIDASTTAFGLHGLEQTFLATGDLDARGTLDGVVQAVHTFVGHTPQFDDMTLLACRRQPAG